MSEINYPDELAPATVVRAAASCPRPSGTPRKRRLLGPPMVTEQLKEGAPVQAARAGRTILRRDLVGRLRHRGDAHRAAARFGLAAFRLIVPMTLVILFGIVIVVLSYREVVSVYTRAGGSYVVARENSARGSPRSRL